jgi:hypothetical protein
LPDANPIIQNSFYKLDSYAFNNQAGNVTSNPFLRVLFGWEDAVKEGSFHHEMQEEHEKANQTSTIEAFFVPFVCFVVEF